MGMKAEHILLLVLAGALGGAGLMKLVQKPQPVAVAAVKAQIPAVAPPPPAPAPAPAPEPVVSQKVAVAPPTAPALVVRPHVHVERAARPAMPRGSTFAAKPSPFAPPREVAIVAQVQPAPAAPPVEVAKAAPPETPPTPSLPPARVEPEPVTPAPPPQPPTVTLNAGMLIPVRLVDGLSSERNAPGDTFAATLDRELVADGFVIAERGARVEGRVVAAGRGTKMKGGAELKIELTRLDTSDGQQVAIRTDSFDKQMEPNHRQDAGKIAGGAVLGAAIGAIAGGGKGAAAGAGVGGGAGTGDVLLTRKQATLASETRISFRLSAPVILTERQ
jgi:hypothetical protein